MTTTTIHIRNRHKDGFTLIELMIGMTLGSIAIAAVVSSMIFMIRSCRAIGNYYQMNRETRYALEVFGRDMRMAKDVFEIGDQYFRFEVEDISGTFTEITYDIQQRYPDGDTSLDKVSALVRTDENGTEDVLFYYVNGFTFSYYNTRDEATTAVISIKKVQIDAELLRSGLLVTTTNDVLSARFTLRNHANSA